jgi:hypothetical protein
MSTTLSASATPFTPQHIQTEMEAITLALMEDINSAEFDKELNQAIDSELAEIDELAELGEIDWGCDVRALEVRGCGGASLGEIDNQFSGTTAAPKKPCRFGAGCRNPECRFGAGCRNPECQFGHPNRWCNAEECSGACGGRHAKKTKPVTICRFGAGCSNPKCSFGHPNAWCNAEGCGGACRGRHAKKTKPVTICRFGARCRNPKCWFSH